MDHHNSAMQTRNVPEHHGPLHGSIAFLASREPDSGTAFLVWLDELDGSRDEVRPRSRFRVGGGQQLSRQSDVIGALSAAAKVGAPHIYDLGLASYASKGEISRH